MTTKAGTHAGARQTERAALPNRVLDGVQNIMNMSDSYAPASRRAYNEAKATEAAYSRARPSPGDKYSTVHTHLHVELLFAEKELERRIAHPPAETRGWDTTIMYLTRAADAAWVLADMQSGTRDKVQKKMAVRLYKYAASIAGEMAGDAEQAAQLRTYAQHADANRFYAVERQLPGLSLHLFDIH